MKNQGYVICRAYFKSSMTPLAWIFAVLWWIIGFVFLFLSRLLYSLYLYSRLMFYNTEFLLKELITIIIFVFVIASPFIVFFIRKFIANRCKLELTEGQIEGQLKTTFGKKKLQIPIDHLDNVMTSSGFWDKIRGGETLLISSNSGLIKFHYVRNAEEFAQVAMKRIDEVKKSATMPQTAPVQNVSGSDAMEKINSLKQMLDAGLISQEDFDQKKNDILSKM